MAEWIGSRTGRTMDIGYVFPNGELYDLDMKPTEEFVYYPPDGTYLRVKEEVRVQVNLRCGLARGGSRG